MKHIFLFFFTYTAVVTAQNPSKLYAPNFAIINNELNLFVTDEENEPIFIRFISSVPLEANQGWKRFYRTLTRTICQ